MLTIDSSIICGTTIVAVRTPDVFAIAADGQGTFRGGSGPTTSQPVSKIFQREGFLYAISGLTKDANRGFDPVAIIGTSVSRDQRLSHIVAHLKQVISIALKDELERLRTEDPSLFKYAVEGDNRGTSIILAHWEGGEPVAITVHFFGVLDGVGKLEIQTSQLACPGDCPNGVYTFFLGHRKAINKYTAAKGKNMGMSPEEGVRFFVQLEIDAGTPGVGPPISVVRLNRNGIDRLS